MATPIFYLILILKENNYCMQIGSLEFEIFFVTILKNKKKCCYIFFWNLRNESNVFFGTAYVWTYQFKLNK